MKCLAIASGSLVLVLAACSREEPSPTKKTEPLETPVIPESDLDLGEPSGPPAEYGSARLKVEGPPGTATVTANAAAFFDGEVLTKLEIRTTRAFRREKKQTFIVQLVPSPGFVPAPGTYTVREDFSVTTGAMGATVLVHEDAVQRFDWNPTGKVTFIATDDGIRGWFHVQVHDRQSRGSTKARSLQAAGEFDAMVGGSPR
jgi:hypothetical protein